ncbi:OmpA family protein [Candidatus Deferrimicrobium sp.]|uniref:OmpA family protein n=1 Tax=Candidatus Deferrimicrobium sp. TaxID=3060586 RepID=UPI002ED83641
MRNRHLILLVSILLATFLVAGCGAHRQLTKGDTDQFNAISGKIAQAEGMTPGAKVCAPKELAIAKADLDGARHETTESWENYAAYIAKADKSADAVLAKTKACIPPVAKFSANPAEIEPGKCSTLTWSSENVNKANIDQGVGDVAASGSKEVCPPETTQYLLTATGTGGTVYEAATVTVSAPAPPPPPPPPAMAPAPAPAPVRKVIDRLTIRVNFDFDKSSIRKADISELEKAVEFVKKYPDSKVVVVGHTDSRGTDKYNMNLSQRRADAVKKYLVDKGNKTDRITAEGKGEAEPIADNKTEKGRFENRRVEVLIVE